MKYLIVGCVTLLAAIAPAAASTLAPGLYEASGKALYVGIEHELPDPAQNDFFEPATGRTGQRASAPRPHLRCGLREERRLIAAPQGPLGASLYYHDEERRPAIVLIHGADAETREMGFIVPYFVCNGLNVASYDQRGTGESVGNWFFTGPIQKVEDAAAVYDAFAGDRHVESRGMGVWGFSNGGWTAPLLTLRRSIAFMILKSAPTESVLSNIDCEVVMELRQHDASNSDIAQALAMWHSVEAAIFGKASWGQAGRTLSEDAKRSWFEYSLMPKLGVPPPAATVLGLRRAFSYDPTSTLTSVTSPTLALYGANDRKLDSADSFVHMRQYLERGGAHDVTVIMFPGAGHTLEVSANGYAADRPQPFAPGYPEIMLTWLRKRGFIQDKSQGTHR